MTKSQKRQAELLAIPPVSRSEAENIELKELETDTPPNNGEGGGKPPRKPRSSNPPLLLEETFVLKRIRPTDKGWGIGMDLIMSTGGEVFLPISQGFANFQAVREWELALQTNPKGIIFNVTFACNIAGQTTYIKEGKEYTHERTIDTFQGGRPANALEIERFKERIRKAKADNVAERIEVLVSSMQGSENLPPEAQSALTKIFTTAAEGITGDWF